MRVDFNVPLSGAGEVLDATRLEEALPTLHELAAAGVRLILASHCGRPKGQPDPRYSLRPVARKLAELLRSPVAFATDCVGAAAHEAVEAVIPGGVVLLENLRFHAGETAERPRLRGGSWPSWPTPTWTTLSAAPIARTPRWWASSLTCRARPPAG